MKHKADPFSAVLTLGLTLLLTILLGACTADSKPTQSSAALEKAKTIKLASVQFDRLPLAIVITMLHDDSVKCDAARKGVTITLGSDAKQLADAEINLELRDVTLAEALGRVAESVGLKLQATETELLLVGKKAK